MAPLDPIRSDLCSKPLKSRTMQEILVYAARQQIFFSMPCLCGAGGDFASSSTYRQFKSCQYRFSRENCMTLLEIQLDKELTTNCLIETRAKLGELILVAMVIMWAG